MTWSSSEIVSVLVFLLPGFVAAAVFYSFTSHPRPSTFGSVIQALMFTMVVQTVALATKTWIWDWDPGSDSSVTSDVLASVTVATLVGFVAAVISNRNIIHRPVAKLRLTFENSYPSEWSSAFVHNRCYIVLHFKDRRRLYGWPTEWPNDPNKGHFRITEAEWLHGRDETQSVLDEKDPDAPEALEILISVDDVVMVEFVETKQLE